ncbi:synapse differentiation-inducing gene protein 1 [Perognathus longimembris pacificus]|uniref:synapse differentiation-inducing gene protein 1 n=1 Tax=Perognathus longimembris pacificus TaxID=214514 RepID=UPI00201843A6|nr:synapse differentiation-inducing gene protein 1 [Perognathus longimembris pacificus]
MDGIIEQKNVLVHSKISDASKRNGLINTRNFMAESRDGLVSVFPAPQYQSHRVMASGTPTSLDGSRKEPVQQLLDPNTLQQSMESHYRPNIILYSDGVLRSWGDGVAADCCETTFIEDRSPTKDSLEYPDGKFIDLSADDIKIHTLSYDVEEEEELQELESDYSSDTESEDNFLMMPPRDHLGLSVFSMLCCFWPLGIAAFYLSHEVSIIAIIKWEKGIQNQIVNFINSTSKENWANERKTELLYCTEIYMNRSPAEPTAMLLELYHAILGKRAGQWQEPHYTGGDVGIHNSEGLLIPKNSSEMNPSRASSILTEDRLQETEMTIALLKSPDVVNCHLDSPQSSSPSLSAVSITLSTLRLNRSIAFAGGILTSFNAEIGILGNSCEMLFTPRPGWQ